MDYQGLVKELNGRKMYFFSSKPFTEFQDMKPQKYIDTSNHKPKGLWFAPGAVWLSFLLENEDLLESFDYKYIYHIKVNLDEIHYMTSHQDMIELVSDAGYLSMNPFYKDYDTQTVFIDYSRIAYNSSGIMIHKNAFNKRREVYKKFAGYNLPWLESWDVPSGCIWNKKAFKSATLVFKLNEQEKWDKVIKK